MDKLYGDPGVSYEAYEKLRRENERLRAALQMISDDKFTVECAENFSREAAMSIIAQDALHPSKHTEVKLQECCGDPLPHHKKNCKNFCYYVENAGGGYEDKSSQNTEGKNG